MRLYQVGLVLTVSLSRFTESVLQAHPHPINVSRLTPVKVEAKVHTQEPNRVSPAALVSPTAWWPMGLWVVVAGLLAVPIIVLTTFTVLIRARRTGLYSLGTIVSFIVKFTISFSASSSRPLSSQLGTVLNSLFTYCVKF